MTATGDDAVIYVRKSQVRKDRDLPGLERQEDDCRKYCEQHGLNVVAVFTDQQSAWSGPLDKPKPRPGLKKSFEFINEGNAKHFVVWRLDRGTRAGVLGLADLLRPLNENRAALHSVLETIDATIPMGRGVLGILAAQAEQESQNTSTRVKRAKLAEAQAGRYPAGGRRTFTRTLTGDIIPEEARFLEEAAERVLPPFRQGLRVIAKDFNERGCRTPCGNEWEPTVLRRCLLSPVHAGLRVHHGISYPGDWAPLWSVEKLAEIQTALAVKKTKFLASGKYELPMLRSTAIPCGICGASMRPSTNGAIRRYACLRVPGRKNCGKVSVAMVRLEAYLGKKICEPATNWGIDLPHPDESIKRGRSLAEIDADLAADRLALKELTRDRYVLRRLDDDSFTAAHEELNESIARLEQVKLAALNNEPAEPSLIPPLENPELWWKGLDPTERRRVAEAAFVRVVINPSTRPAGAGFDPNRVEITWRPGWIEGLRTRLTDAAGSSLQQFDGMKKRGFASHRAVPPPA